MSEKTVQVTAYLAKSVHRRLKALAESDRRSVSKLAVIAIEDFVKRNEQRVLAPGGMPVSPYQSNIRTAVHPGQVDLEDAIVAAVKRGPQSPKASKHK